MRMGARGGRDTGGRRNGVGRRGGWGRVGRRTAATRVRESAGYHHIGRGTEAAGVGHDCRKATDAPLRAPSLLRVGGLERFSTLSTSACVLKTG